MVHPNALTGKTTNSILDVFEALVALIERKYNADSTYRDPGMPPVKRVYFGEPATGLETPSIAVAIRRVVYIDAPQDAGADVDPLDIDIICYGQQFTREPQQKESIKMAEAVRHILLDNKTVPKADGTETVFQIGYREMTITFDTLLGNFDTSLVGVEVAQLSVPAVFAELGY